MTEDRLPTEKEREDRRRWHYIHRCRCAMCRSGFVCRRQERKDEALAAQELAEALQERACQM